MNGFQIKQRDRITDPTKFPWRALSDFEKNFIESARRWPDEKELSEKQNRILNQLAGLFTT